MREENLTIQISPKNIKCKNCIYAGENPYDCFCCKFRLKPQKVLYDGEDCEEYKPL